LFFLINICWATKPQVDDGVYVLTTKNFDDFVNNEDFTIVEFYAPWCGHCKHLAPEYASAAKDLANDEPPVKLAKVDATVESELGQRFEVRGYPTIKIFRRGKASEYDGPRDAPGIVKYVRSKAGPASRPLETQEAAQKFVSGNLEDGRSAVVFFGNSASPLFAVFKELSNSNREDAKFGHVHDSAVQKSLGHDKEAVVIHLSPRFASKLEQSVHVFTGETKQQLADFFNQHNLPLGGEITSENAHLYKNKGVPVVKVFANLDWQRDHKGANYLLNRIRKVAKEFQNKLSFAIMSKKNAGSDLKDLDMSNIETPFFIHDLKSGMKYRHDKEPVYTPEAMKSFAEEFLAGKVEAFVKSEAIPENNDGPVKVVVGKNFQSIVEDPTKDVLLEVYAPWCGHCKTLEPKYVELGEKMKKHSSVTIAKVDGTANSLPSAFPYTGFPTIFFVPANKKSSPIKYEGPREVNDLINFIKKEASLPISDD